MEICWFIILPEAIELIGIFDNYSLSKTMGTNEMVASMVHRSGPHTNDLSQFRMKNRNIGSSTYSYSIEILTNMIMGCLRKASSNINLSVFW